MSSPSFAKTALRPGGIALALTALSLSLHAQQPTTTAPADDEAETVQALPEVTVTATRSDVDPLEVPGVISVTTREQIDDRLMLDAQDLIRHQPGVTVGRQTSGVDPFANLTSFNIRGVGGNRVRMQVDGVRMQEQIGDGNRSFFDLNTMKAVEVVRGPASVLWGADALGGMVAFRTLDPQDLLRSPEQTKAFRLDAGYDSLNDSFNKTAMGAFRLSPTLEALVSVGHRSYSEAELRKARADGGIWGCPRVEDAIRCNELNPLDADVWTALGKLQWRPNNDHFVKLSADLYDSQSNIRQLYDYGRQANGSFNGDYLREQNQTRRNLTLSHEWSVRAPALDSVRWQFSWSKQKRHIDSVRDQTSAAAVSTQTFTGNHFGEDFLQLDVQLDSSFALGSSQHRLTYGLQADQVKTDQQSYNRAHNLSTGNVTSSVTASFANATTRRTDLYIQDEISLLNNRLIVTPGVRWANSSIDPRPGVGYRPVEGFDAVKRSSNELIPQVGSIFHLTDVYSVYARYAEGFKTPSAYQLYASSPGATFNTIPAPDLRPESVKSYELGWRGQFESGWFSLGAFKADYTDFIQGFYNVPDTNNYTSRNLSSVDLWGIEASAQWKLSRALTADASLSYQRGTQVAAPGEEKTHYNGASPWNGSLGLTWNNWANNLQVEGVANFAQGIKRKSSETLLAPGGYIVFDTYVNWKPVRNLTLRAGVQNLFDRRYFKGPFPYTYSETTSDAVKITNPIELQTQPGRSFKLSATYEF